MDMDDNFKETMKKECLNVKYYNGLIKGANEHVALINKSAQGTRKHGVLPVKPGRKSRW